MTEDQDLKEIASDFTDEWLTAWMEEHLPELKQSVSGQRFLYQSLVFACVVGLAAHVGGYLLLLSASGGLLGLLADLLHALGWSLWTGAIVAVFVQVIPEAKRQQIRQAVEAYEALRREQVRAAGGRAEATSERPRARRVKRGQGQKRPRKPARKRGKVVGAK
jgi:hypothetical protein